MLVATLIGMGVCTTMIGLLPTYAQIGVAAPIILLVLRLIQGLCAGGEWGGAALMAVEHAAPHKRGLAEPTLRWVFPGHAAGHGRIRPDDWCYLPGDAFLEWGWRVPFLLSFVLVLLGHFIRRSVDETPIYQDIAKRKQQTKAPVAVLFKKHWALIICSAVLFAGTNASGYIATGGFVTAYTTNPDGPIAFDRTTAMLCISCAAAVWFITTLLSGIASDYFGRRNTYLFGYLWLIVFAFPMFAMVNTAEPLMVAAGLSLFAVGLGFSFGPQAAWYTELFPANIRFSGVSISYGVGTVIGGAFAPTIGQGLLDATGSTNAIAVYIIVMSALSVVAALLLQDVPRRALGIDHQEEQEHYARLRLGSATPYTSAPQQLADANATPANSEPEDLERITT